MSGILRYTILITLMAMAGSCIYEPPVKVTYVNKDVKPPDLQIIALDMNTDTLVIWSQTRFTFSIESSGAAVEGIIMKLSKHTENIASDQGHFDVNPDDLAEGFYTLTMDVYTHSGTGSLADMYGHEGFLFHKEWIVKIMHPGTQIIKFNPPTIENGFLKFTWNSTNVPFFINYKITLSDSIQIIPFTKTITARDTTWLVDSSFIGGVVNASLSVRMKNSSGGEMEYISDRLTYRFPVHVTMADDLDSLRIKWNYNPFNHKLEINSTLCDPGLGTTYSLKSQGLGYPKRYQVKFKPVVKQMYDWMGLTFYIDYTAGRLTGLIYNRVEYFPPINSWIVKSPAYFRRFDGTSFQNLAGLTYPQDSFDQSTIAVSPDGSRAYTTINQNIVELNISDFSVMSQKQFGPSSGGSRTFKFLRIINDSIMYIVSNSTFSIYNFRNATVLASASVSSSYGAPFNITVSADNRYLANCLNDRVRVFRISDTLSIEQIYENTGNYLECIFDPVHNDNLLLITIESAFFVHCPDMSVIQTIPENIKGYAINFDPVTNNLLFVSGLYNTVTIYDFINDAVKFHCNHHGDFYDFYLVNGILFHKSGYMVDTR